MKFYQKKKKTLNKFTEKDKWLCEEDILIGIPRAKVYEIRTQLKQMFLLALIISRY